MRRGKITRFCKALEFQHFRGSFMYSREEPTSGGPGSKAAPKPFASFFER